MVDESVPRCAGGRSADLGAEMARIRGDGAEGLRGGAKKDAVDHRRVLPGDLGDGLGHGEHDMEVLRVEQGCGAVLDPRRARQRLARGAMAIPAAAVPDAGVRTAVARLDMAAARGGAAGLAADGLATLRARDQQLGLATAEEKVA